MRNKLIVTIIAAAAMAAGIFLNVEISGPRAALANPPTSQPIKVVQEKPNNEAPAQDNVVQPGAPAEPAAPSADKSKPDADPTPEAEPTKCEDNDGCESSDLCDRGVCIPDPCLSVVFSKTDDGKGFGCKAAEIAHFHGYQDGDAQDYLIKLGHSKNAEKKMKKFNAELERRTRRLLWQTKSYDISADDIAKLKPEEVREKMEETATIGDLMHLTVRMDQKIYSATHKAADTSADEPAKEENAKK